MNCQLVLVAVALVAAAYADDVKLEWWQEKMIYQVYPASFKDSDGDGKGDLKGIKSKVDHFKDINAGGVWLSPIYPSPLKDNGYDISNFTGIDKQYGTMDDFDDLVKALNESTTPGIKLIMDFVPNHSSDQHPWFLASKKNDSKYRDYYIWYEGDKLPNNWRSITGGSAWTYVKERNASYYHAFGSFQPDLNYNNTKVVDEMKNVLKFWMDKGVHGFRMDAVPYLVEDSRMLDEPVKPGCNDDVWSCLSHNYTMDQPMTYDILAQFRKFMDDYKSNDTESRVMMVEAYTTLNKTIDYYGTKQAPIANFPFNFFLLDLSQSSNAKDFVKVVNSWMKKMNDDRWPNWVTGNHDNSRVGTKMGREMIDGMNMALMLLPGTAISYYGEEIGMTDTYVREDQLKDKAPKDSRDPERTPFQWTGDLNAGFCETKNSTWLPINPNYWYVNVDNETKSDAPSHLKNYKRLSQLHAQLAKNSSLEVKTVSSDYVFGFVRRLSDNDPYVTVLNLDNENQVVNITDAFKITSSLYIHTASINSEKKQGDAVNLTSLSMKPKECLVLWNSVDSVRPQMVLMLVSSFILYLWRN